VRVSRRRGHARIRLEAVESGLLGTLFDDLEGALVTLPDDDPVRQRLFPSGYRDDERAEAEFRALTEDSLRDTKAERLRECRAELPSGEGDIDLDDGAAQRWLTVLTDLRLAIGTRLSVTEDDEPTIDPADPDAQLRAIYQWLTTLQDSLVHVVMRG
jgi:Domain of unknown function (DUF2017)